MNSDIVRLILSYLDNDTLSEISDMKYFYYVCNDNFWINKIIEVFRLTISEINSYKDGPNRYPSVVNTYKAYYFFLVSMTKSKPYTALECTSILNNNSYSLLPSGTYPFGGSPEGIRPDVIIIGLRTNNMASTKGIFIWSCLYGHYQVAKILLLDGASTVSTEEKEQGLHISSMRGHADIARLIISSPNGPDPRSDVGYLSYAARFGQFEMVKLLIEEYNMDPTMENNETIKYACESGHYRITQYLLSKGADVHVDQDYLLLSACSNGHAEIVKLLLDYGANIHVRNDTPIKIARTDGNNKLIRILESYGAK